jgi:hypothetical protein
MGSGITGWMVGSGGGGSGDGVGPGTLDEAPPHPRAKAASEQPTARRSDMCMGRFIISLLLEVGVFLGMIRYRMPWTYL